MNLSSDRSINVFVLGDVVLDNLLRVEPRSGIHDPSDGPVYTSLPVITTAGGAANCARAFAALNGGRTVLWGLTGCSEFAPFSRVLRDSNIVDGGRRPPILLASHNESSPMNSITRVVCVDGHGSFTPILRRDELSYVHVTRSQEADALGHLQAEADEHGVHAIIVNDLDMHALSENLISDVAEFASINHIPLFIDPKRNWKKYRAVKATCFLPNLNEWCHIVEDSESEAVWRAGLSSDERLQRMAVRCLRYLPHAKSYVIKCDRDGAVLVLPGEGRVRRVLHILPHPTTRPNLPRKLGSGDILVSVLAMEYALRGGEPEDQRLQGAFETASAVVACYRTLDWHRMVNRRDLEQFQNTKSPILMTTQVSEGVLHLPENKTINLAEVSICGSRMVSWDPAYKAEIKRLADTLRSGWDWNNLRSAILTGRGGTGKSVAVPMLTKVLREIGVFVVELKPRERGWLSVMDACRDIEMVWKAQSEPGSGLLVVMDEAFSKTADLLRGEAGKLLLQHWSPEQGMMTRFLFIDADYDRHREELSESQFVSRCDVFRLPSVAERPWDIPYIFASACYDALTGQGVALFAVTEAVLLAVTNWVLLERHSAREIVAEADAIVKGLPPVRPPGIVEISKRYLRADVLRRLGFIENDKTFYNVIRDANRVNAPR